MRTLAWVGCFLIGCSSVPTSENTDGGGLDVDAGYDVGTDSGTDAGTNPDGGGPDGGSGSLVYSQSFAGVEGSDWPAPWYPITNHLTLHDLHNNQGRFRSDGQDASPGRMQLPNFSERDVDVSWTVTFEDPTNQGSGFYVRQSGQYLGEGYVLFLEGNSPAPATHLGFWRAVNGVEERFYDAPTPTPSPFLPNTRYRMRFQVVQIDPNTTRLRGKVWPAIQTEPSTWQIEASDSAPSLQNARGTFAFDVYNYYGTANVLVADLIITRP